MHKKTVQTSHILSAKTEKVWATISKASGVNEWLPIITACRLEGKGEGSKRICTTAQGDMKETILKIDEEHKVFQYAIDEQPLLPIGNIVGTMKVNSKDERTELLWDLDFEISDESQFPMVKQAVEEMYRAGATGLETISQ
ncbi:SRPBCC family protein [Maribacter sp. 2308TA10-17]|uniref:SRPBCC family protein n=1 Tax=Maribacter sp. 2308TA10-17 TaxID=3386276 RepID=UPI0039BCD012